MSADSDKVEPADDQPRFQKETRVRIALSKHYGLDGDEWAVEEIADYLNVGESTVKEYLYDSEMAEDMEHMLEQRQATTRMKLMQRMHDRLERLDEVEQKVADEKKVVPSMFRMKEAQVEIDPSDIQGLEVPDDDLGGTTTTMEVPVPSNFTEVPNVEELKDVWREIRLTEEQLEDLMGLEEPDEVEHQGGQTVDVKHWQMDDNLPEADVVDVDGGEVGE